LNLKPRVLSPCVWATGTHLVDGKGGPEGALGKFVDDVMGPQ